MKQITLLLLMTIAAPASAEAVFPDYEANEVCGDIIASQIANGEAAASDTAEMLAMCEMAVDMFKPVAKGLWNRSSTELRSECLDEAKRRASERGVAVIWYPHLADCMAPKDHGKGGRIGKI